MAGVNGSNSQLSYRIPQQCTEIYLKNRPYGMLQPDVHFGTRQVALPDENHLQEDEVLVRVLWLSCDPAMRGWMSSAPSYIEPVEIGAKMRAAAVGEVIGGSSLNKGVLVTGSLGWCDYAVAKKSSLREVTLPEGLSPTSALSILGLTGLTAYFGLLEVGNVHKGDTVVVTAAAGAVGSTVAQIAKNIYGCYTVGIAGGPVKCKYLREELQLDAVVDYKEQRSIGSSLHEALHGRKVDVFFDNVGGETLEAGLAELNKGGRVVLCGAISVYNNKEPPTGPRNYLQLLVTSSMMRGFVVFDFEQRYGEAMQQLGKWSASGVVKTRVDITHGLENAPDALKGLFEGRNHGKVIVQVAIPESERVDSHERDGRGTAKL